MAQSKLDRRLCRIRIFNNGRFSLEGNGEEVSTKVILNLKSTVDGVIVENMQNYDILLLKEGTFYDCMFGY